jgi:hypothetical protein
LPLETLLPLFKKYKDVPSKSAGIDAYAGAYGEKLLSARLSFLFLLSAIHTEVYLVVTSLILI